MSSSFFVSLPRIIILLTYHYQQPREPEPEPGQVSSKESKKTGHRVRGQGEETYESQRAEKEKEGIARDGADQGSTPTNQKPGEQERETGTYLGGRSHNRLTCLLARFWVCVSARFCLGRDEQDGRKGGQAGDVSGWVGVY
jgi:hypothetical protein